MGRAGDLQPQAALSYLVIGTGTQQGSRKANIICLKDQNSKNGEVQDRHAERKLPSTVKNLALHGNHCLGIVMSLRMGNNYI